MKLFIPPLRTTLLLLKPLSCSINFVDSRNAKFSAKIAGTKYEDILDDYYENRKTPSFMNVVIPQETALTIDRIYIRNNLPKYDSVTFRVMSSPLEHIIKQRFWISLAEANTIDYQIVK